MEKKNTTKRYVCGNCGKSFSTKPNLHSHKKIAHSSFRYDCTLCHKQYKDLDSLQDHVQYWHKGKKYNCELCESTFTFRSRLSTHRREMHANPTIYGCKICEKTFSHKTTLKIHISFSHRGISNKCALCEKEFATIMGLKRHIQDCHENGRTRTACTYENCDATVSSKGYLKIHIKNAHQKKPAYECDICHGKYASQESLRNPQLAGSVSTGYERSQQKPINPR